MKKEGLGKVVLRIVVAALIVALIVLILMTTVFKVSSSKKAYNALNNAFAPNGTITSMTEQLDDFDEFDAEYGNFIYVFKSELKNLQASYTKLYYVGNIDDEQMNEVSNQLNEMKKSLEDATKLIKDVNIGKKNNTELNLSSYVESLKPKIVNALYQVLSLNCNIQEFLTKNYYNATYFEQPFLSKLEAFIAMQYYVCAEASYNSEIANEVFNFYKYLNANGFDNSTIEKTNQLNQTLKILPEVNLFRIVDNVYSYKKENEEDTALVSSIEKVENYINSISSTFSLSDIANAKGAK